MKKHNINNEVTDTFEQLRNELNTHLNTAADISGKREFLGAHVSKEVIYKSNLLFDTLLNSLMADATAKLEDADVDIEVQNKFYEADFRKKIQSWVEEVSNTLKLNPEAAEFSFDPRLKDGLIAGGGSLLVGSGLTLSPLIKGVALTVTGGIATIIISAIAFKLFYEKGTPKALNQIKDDIETYLIESESQVKTWLHSVEIAFENELKEFYLQNNVKV